MGPVFAATPQVIDYQGYLMENSAAVTGTKSITFSLYDASTGGSLLCTSGAQSVTVTKGVFTYQIGTSGCTLSSVDFDSAVYLELSVEGTTMSPREQVAGSAYSVQTKAMNVVFTPTGNVAATDVQSAIAELDSEKLSLAGGTVTGTVTATAFVGDGGGLTGINASALDHGSMGGLTDDDHTQYFNLIQNETVTGTPVFSAGANMSAPLLIDGNTAETSLAVTNSGAGSSARFTNANATATIYAENTNASGYGIEGRNTSNGYGILGQNTGSGAGVAGANTSTGAGVYGYNSSTGPGLSGNNDSAGYSIYGANSGTGDLFMGNHTGTHGNLLRLDDSGSPAFIVENVGNVFASGTIALNTGSASAMVDATQTGAGMGGNFQITGGGAGHALIGNTDGTGNAVQAQNSGTGNVYNGNHAGTHGDLINLQTGGSPAFVVENAGNVFASGTAYFADKVGIGTTTPAAVGAARLELYGTADSVAAGPHFQAVTSADAYPVFQLLNYNHDNVALNFDMYWDGAFKSSDVGSNFQIYKINDKLNINYGSGVAAGGNAVMNPGIILDAAGKVGMGTVTPMAAGGGVLELYGPAFSPSDSPSFQAVVDTDAYPIFQNLNYSHDNVALNFDMYYQGGTWYSADPGSNFQIYKISDVLKFTYDSGVAAGVTPTMNDGIVMTSAGDVGIGTSSPGSRLQVSGGDFTMDTNRKIYFGSTAFITHESGTGVPMTIAGSDTVQIIIDSNNNQSTAYFSIESNDPDPHSSTEFFRVQENGRVGIGTDTPLADLHVNGTAGNPTGTWGTYSDRRLKKNITDIHSALDKLSRLRGVTFQWIDPEEYGGGYAGTRMGFIAQEAEQVFPEWVETWDNGYKSITPMGLDALTVEAVKELKQENDILRQRIAVLEQKLPDME